MSGGKKCPNCGACQECGHAPNRGSWVTPYYPGTSPGYQPWWGVVHPWTTDGTANPTHITWTTNTSGAAQ